MDYSKTNITVKTCKVYNVLGLGGGELLARLNQWENN